MKPIVRGIFVSVLGLFAAGCADVDRKAMEPMMVELPAHVPAKGATPDVCNRKVLLGHKEPGDPAPEDVMLLLAFNRLGVGTLYVCDKGLPGDGGPGTGNPAETRPSKVPGGLKEGKVFLLPPSYRKLQDGDDPCIKLNGGGSRAYYCW